uniref:LysR family transcriptional regulator n=1 Tax=Thaumasiovibrio occultus TaxID=1891184 RepID=UPI000B35D415|nr:LysR family transcriptional regulator [Thaumasiovibrio occultus]
MKNSLLNPTWLHTFVTLVDTGHFTETAKRLFMTQPGVTQHIQKLEAELNTALLRREGKKFELTAEGEKLYRYALAQVTAHQAFLDDLQDNDPYKGECQIACSGGCAMQLYPALIALQQAHPQLHLSVEAAPNRRIVDMVSQNQVTFGIVTQKPVDESLSVEPIGTQTLSLFLPATYQSAADDIEWQHLANLGYIDHPDAQHYLDRILTKNYRQDFRGLAKLTRRGYINQLNQILLPVAAGIGFTALPHATLHYFAKPEAVRAARLPQTTSDTLYLVYKTHRGAIQRFLWLKDVLENALAETQISP